MQTYVAARATAAMEGVAQTAVPGMLVRFITAIDPVAGGHRRPEGNPREELTAALTNEGNTE
jgi:hypothetical protein